jgi:hypothetical protein
VTLLTALVGGLACGYLLGWRPRAVAVWLVVWALVLAVQTRFLVSPADVADWSYWPVQAVIVAVALGMLRVGAMVRAGRARPHGEGARGYERERS